MNKPSAVAISNAVESNQWGSDNVGFFDDLNDNPNAVRTGSSSDNEESGEDDDYSDSGELSINQSDDNVVVEGNRFSWKEVLKEITIEPMMFAQMFAFCMTAVVQQNLYIDRICKITLDQGDEICNNLADHDEIETEIDQIAAKFGIYRSLIECGYPILISLFLGPWTDIHGTKWPMMIPYLGYSLSAIFFLIFAHAPNVSPEVLLIASAPVSVVGGMVAVVMTAFSFIAKTSTVKNRSFRIAMLEAAWGLGGPLGTLSGGLLFKYGGFTLVFSVAALVYIVAFIYGCFVIREELPVVDDAEERNCCADMFNVEAVREMFATIFRRREGHRRGWLLLLLATISVRIFAMLGGMMNMYLYTRSKFDWDLSEFTKYSVTDAFISIAGGYLMIMTCMKLFKVPDPILGILSTVGTIGAQFVFAFAVSGWMLYLGTVLQMFAGVMSIPIRSMISKIVAKEEIAKVFTVLACSEAAMPLIGAPLYSLVFSSTVATFPGAFLMVAAGAYFIVFLSFVYVYFAMRGTVDHTELEDSTESTP